MMVVMQQSTCAIELQAEVASFSWNTFFLLERTIDRQIQWLFKCGYLASILLKMNKVILSPE